MSPTAGPGKGQGRRQPSRGGRRTEDKRAAGARAGKGGGDRGLGGDQVEGRQAVRELLAGRRAVQQVLVAEGMDEAPILGEIEALAARRRVRVIPVSRRRIDSLARSEAPQGVVALARPVEAVPLASLCEASPSGETPFLLVVDGISDPQNLGSLLRSAECAGVTGVVLARHRSVHLSPTVTKVAAGAVEHLSMALVPGVPSALERLSSLGVWTVGLVAGASQSVYGLTFADAPVALVVGSEGAGLSRLTERRCDVLASIPQHGAIASLNVAVAGAVACFEIARRRAGQPAPAGKTSSRRSNR